MRLTQLQKAERFRELHSRAGAFVIPNPWDAGSARILERLEFEALTTPSAASSLTDRRGPFDGTSAFTGRDTDEQTSRMSSGLFTPGAYSASAPAF